MPKKRKRQRQLDMAVAAIRLRYGPQALVKGKPSASTDSAAVIPHIPTGFPSLDRALGIGGLPKGKISELVGPATSGKTTLALKFLAQATDVFEQLRVGNSCSGLIGKNTGRSDLGAGPGGDTLSHHQ